MFLRISRRIALSLFLLAVCGNAGAAAPLRIATFNLEWLVTTANENNMSPWKNEEDLEKHRRNLAQILAENVHADIVCVLESTSKRALEKLVSEPALSPMHYRIYHLESEDFATGQDVAFLARVPLDRIAGRDINDFRGRGKDPLTKRAIIYLTSGKLKLGILGMHLLAHPDDARRTRRRISQASAASRLVRDEIVARGYTPIVLGDLNDFDSDIQGGEGYSKRRRVIHILKDFDWKKSGDELFNSAERIQSLSERYSAYWDLNKNGIRDRDEPLSLMDHILIDRSLSARLMKAEILHEPKDGSVSDHWPVVVELTTL